MSSYKIILSDNAYKDIRNISKYISTELHDKDAAKRLLSIFLSNYWKSIRTS